MHRTKLLCVRLILSLLALLVAAGSTGPAQAGGPNGSGSRSVLVQGTWEMPEGDSANLARDGQGSVIGGVSTALACLSTGKDFSCPSAGIVALGWQGPIERARLVFSLPDLQHAPRAAHTIRVNGQAATTAPLCGTAHPCVAGETFYARVPAEMVRPGDNQIEITADGLPGETWTATHVRLVVYGRLRPTSLAAVPEDVTAAASAAVASTSIITFVNPYDGTDQEAVIHIRTGHDGNTPAPLVIYAHGRTGVMEDGMTHLGAATEAKNWLIASPQMHGSWKVPEICKDYPNPDSECDYWDRMLAGTRSKDDEAVPGALAHASLESQYDIIGLVQTMIDRPDCNVELDQIYLVGGSMGGQIVTVTGAKFPDVFAAVYDFKGITDLEQWYGQVSYHDQLSLRKECHLEGTPAHPGTNSFCYERRSSTNYARNYLHVPISITHSISDTMVPITHSYELRDAINSFSPDHPASVRVDETAAEECEPPYYHCLEPAGEAILGFMQDHILDSRPGNIRISTDESKSYYWMNLVQMGGDRWSHVDVTQHKDRSTLLVEIEDRGVLSIGLNLGSTALPNDVLLQPGMGLPATTYLVKGAGHDRLVDYTSGYLPTIVDSAGTSSFTVSAITMTLDAEPTFFPAGQEPKVSALTVQVQDQNDPPNPVPDGTEVRLVTTAGTFPYGQESLTLSTTGGQVTTTLTLGAQDVSAEVVATVHTTVYTVSAFAAIEVIHPSIDVAVSSNVQETYYGKEVTYQYTVHNNGDSPLSGVTVTDDNGTPGDGSDDVTVCTGIALQAGEERTYSRPKVLEETTTIQATAVGVDLLGKPVSHQATATVIVRRRVFVPLVIQ